MVAREGEGGKGLPRRADPARAGGAICGGKTGMETAEGHGRSNV